MSNSRETRYIFDGLYNFRDFGGLSGDGGKVKHGILFRSDAFGDASERDISILLKEIGINRILDLRTDREISAEKPTPMIEMGIDYRRRIIDSGPGSAIENAPAGERLAYRYMEYFGFGRDSIISVVKDLSEDNSWKTVIHCRAGKDRTGVIAAVVLGILGVSEEEISKDYALTGLAMPKIMERLRQSPTYSANVSRLPEEMYSAVSETMGTFIKFVSEKFGSFENWALNNGVTGDEIRRLRSNLLE